MQAIPLETRPRPPSEPTRNGAGESGSVRDVPRDAHGTTTAVCARIDEVARQQVLLSHKRELLLVKRSKLRSYAHTVRKHRTAIGDAEARFLESIRECQNCFKSDQKLPCDIDLAYGQLVEMRDALGCLEADYLTADSELVESEWEFMKQESNFYQFTIQDIVEKLRATTMDNPQASLVGYPLPSYASSSLRPPTPPPPPLPQDLLTKAINVRRAPPPPPPPPLLSDNIRIVHDAPPPPPPRPRPGTTFIIRKKASVNQLHNEVLSELERLNKELNLLRSRQTRSLDVGSSGFYETYSELMSKIAACKIKLSYLKQDDVQHGTPEYDVRHRTPNLVHLGEASSHTSENKSSANGCNDSSTESREQG